MLCRTSVSGPPLPLGTCFLLRLLLAFTFLCHFETQKEGEPTVTLLIKSPPSEKSGHFLCKPRERELTKENIYVQKYSYSEYGILVLGHQ